MLNHAVIRTDRMSGTDDRSQLVSVKFYDGNGKPADIDNGNLVEIGGLLDGEREIYEAKAPTANTDKDDLVIVGTPELLYDERLRALDDFYNKADRPARAYRLHKGDIFSVTKEAFGPNATAPKVGDTVVAGTDTYLHTSAGAESEIVIGRVMHIETNGYTYYAIEVRPMQNLAAPEGGEEGGEG